MSHYGFVVLNYENYYDTIDCVESILQIVDTQYSVVIVDNDSKNNSIGILKDKYCAEPRVVVIESGSNGGYSKGNNVGIRLLHQKGIRNIIIATSDTIILSPTILTELERLVGQGAVVIGPMVATPTGATQNPMEPKLTWRYFLNIYAPDLARIVGGILRMVLSISASESESKRHSKKEEDVYMVHGCFLFLSKAYFEAHGLLDESLFMYGEEDLIAYNCRLANQRVVYSPQISVFHKDAGSTPVHGRKTFTAKHKRDSMRYLRKSMRAYYIIKWLLRLA